MQTLKQRDLMAVSTTTHPTQTRTPSTLDVPVLLARWRTRELALAHRFRECNGAGNAEIEDILDNTITALLERAYTSEKHLFRALRKGVKMRALRLHRDRTERERILTHTAPVIHIHEQDRAWRDDPERALIAREDDLIISEFLSDLTKQEREVFVLHANGRSWRAIATALGLPGWDARALTRSCEQKRERFLTLYLTGRLCGYRSRTISNILTGALSGNELALKQALVHLNHCRRCQTEHDTTTEKLRNAFDHRALAFLPIPLLLTSTHTHVLDRAQALLERSVHILARFTHPHSTGTRQRIAETIAGTGAAAKITVGVASLAVLAGGTIGISRTLEPSHRTHTRPPIQQPSLAPKARETTATPISLRRLEPSGSLAPSNSNTQRYAPPVFGPGHTVPYPSNRTIHRTVGQQREPPGFAYLGVPAREVTAHNAAPSTSDTNSSQPVDTLAHSSGGPFTP